MLAIAKLPNIRNHDVLHYEVRNVGLINLILRDSRWEY